MGGLSWDDATLLLELGLDMMALHGGDSENAIDWVTPSESTILYDLDLGVAAVVVALSAAGPAPIYSCNGSLGYNSAHPMVTFCCHKGRVRDILMWLN